MENIFETIYYGARPYERPPYKESQQMHRDADSILEVLKQSLTSEQSHLLDEYIDQKTTAHVTEEYLRFCDGFRMAMRLVLASMTTAETVTLNI